MAEHEEDRGDDLRWRGGFEPAISSGKPDREEDRGENQRGREKSESEDSSERQGTRKTAAMTRQVQTPRISLDGEY